MGLKEFIWPFIQHILMSILPWIISRRIYSLQDFEKDIGIDIRSIGDPVSFDLQNIPQLAVYFEIRNMSRYFDVAVDTLFLSIWLKESGYIFREIHVHFVDPGVPKGEVKVMHFCINLNCFQVEKLKGIKRSGKELYCKFYIECRFHSKHGDFQKKEILENVRYQLNL